jgi:hypothetical protein
MSPRRSYQWAQQQCLPFLRACPQQPMRDTRARWRRSDLLGKASTRSLRILCRLYSATSSTATTPTIRTHAPRRPTASGRLQSPQAPPLVRGTARPALLCDEVKAEPIGTTGADFCGSRLEPQRFECRAQDVACCVIKRLVLVRRFHEPAPDDPAELFWLRLLAAHCRHELHTPSPSLVHLV